MQEYLGSDLASDDSDANKLSQAEFRAARERYSAMSKKPYERTDIQHQKMSGNQLFRGNEQSGGQFYGTNASNRNGFGVHSSFGGPTGETSVQQVHQVQQLEGSNRQQRGERVLLQRIGPLGK